MVEEKLPRNTKISAEFAGRLARLKPNEKIRAIVLLSKIRPSRGALGGRQTFVERKIAIERVLQSAEQALAEIDSTFDRFNGRRLADKPNALASIPVETTPAGIRAIAGLNCVAAVIEDQEVHPIS